MCRRTPLNQARKPSELVNYIYCLIVSPPVSCLVSPVSMQCLAEGIDPVDWSPPVRHMVTLLCCLSFPVPSPGVPMLEGGACGDWWGKVLASVLCSQPCASWWREEEGGGCKQMLVGGGCQLSHLTPSHHHPPGLPVITSTHSPTVAPPPVVGQLTESLHSYCSLIVEKFLYLILRER